MLTVQVPLNPGNIKSWLLRPSTTAGRLAHLATRQLRGSQLPGLSGLSDEGFSRPKALQEWATHKTADPAGVLQAALASLKLEPDSSKSSSTTTHSSSGGSQTPVPLMHASGMRPQLQHMLPCSSSSSLLSLCSGLCLDADLFTRVSPLSQLSKCVLHLQQQLPCGESASNNVRGQATHAPATSVHLPTGCRSSSTAVSCITLHCSDCCPVGLSMTPLALGLPVSVLGGPHQPVTERASARAVCCCWTR